MSIRRNKAILFTYFFELQLNIKTFHWLTKSYGKHKATDTLYEKISDHTDKFIEVYMGKYNRPLVSQENVIYKYMNDKEFIEYLKKTILFLEKDLFKFISSNDTDLLNIRDEIVSDINQTMYLFTLD